MVFIPHFADSEKHWCCSNNPVGNFANDVLWMYFSYFLYDLLLGPICRGKYRLPNAPSDGEKPLYLHISAAAHVRNSILSMILTLQKMIDNLICVSALYY